jgi:hypothetical protein
LGIPPKGTADLAIGRRRARGCKLASRLTVLRLRSPSSSDRDQHVETRSDPESRRVQPTIQLMTSVGRHTGSQSAILPGMAKRPKQTKQKNPAAVALGRLGGLRRRWKNIPPEQRSEAMRKAAQARRRTKKKRLKD